MAAPIIVVPFMKPAGMALFPFILIHDEKLKANKTLIRHENIHLQQQIELLVIPFYLLYVINYLVNLLQYKNHQQAYIKIIFEREAYQHENDVDYLTNRKLWGWIKYLKIKQ
jgi:hypothetical protein